MRRSLYFKLFQVVAVAAIIGLVAVSAISVPKTSGGINKAAKLPQVPVCAFGFDPRYSPSAGETVTYTLAFGICKTLKVSVEYVVPATVKITMIKPKPTRWVHGNPVWVKRVSRRATPSKTLRLTYASNLQPGQVIKAKVIFRARGYRPFVQPVKQHAATS